MNAKTPGNSCVTPAGDDLNEVFATTDAFVAPFCTQVRTGNRWRTVVRITAAATDPVFPSGYTPLKEELDDDFLAKFTSARYVVDAGTKRERTFAVSAAEHMIQTGTLPDGTVFVRWVTTALHPLPPGRHTVDQYVTMSADYWDGLGIDPSLNFIPAGDSAIGRIAFDVVRRRT